MEGTKTATDELRALLDARGVKYDAVDEYVTSVYLDDRYITFLQHGDRFSVEVVYPRPIFNGTAFLTPAQAVEATLGRGEREVAYDGELWWKCLGCGERWRQEQGEPGFCPRCGGKAVGR